MSSQFEQFDKAYMNALTALHESCSCRYTKRPVEVDAEQIFDTRVINTLEGDITANPTDWVITGVEGEKYPCPNETFEEFYEKCDNGKYRKKPLPVTAWQTTRELLIPHNGESFRASIGDYIVQQPNGSFCAVKPDIFDKTYDKCEE